MTYWQIAGGILVAIASFGAGWLAATEKVRIEVYKARLDVYRIICRKAASMLMISLDFETKKMDEAEKAKTGIKLNNAALELVEEFLAAGAIISGAVRERHLMMSKALESEDYIKLWHEYVVLASVMERDLGLKQSFTITDGLLNPKSWLKESIGPLRGR